VKVIGLVIPTNVLARASEVVEIASVRGRRPYMALFARRREPKCRLWWYLNSISTSDIPMAAWRLMHI
jgi:hypothetical protein